MKALLLHCKKFSTLVTKFSNRPAGITPEPVKNKELKTTDAVVALITVEPDDQNNDAAANIGNDLIQMATDTGHKNIILMPFGHLSNKLADSRLVIKVFDEIEAELNKRKMNVLRGHFGSHKELSLDLFGHPGNVRFRDY